MRKQYDDVCLHISGSREEMGRRAARDAAECLRSLLKEEEEVNCVFAAAPSQNEFLEALCVQEGIEWTRVNAWHMDEYVGIPVGAPGSFSGFLKNIIFDRLPFKEKYLIHGLGDPKLEARRYGDLLRRAVIHITFMGIGENGHIAFNDPGEADFTDPLPMKMVKLDSLCRMQQVHDGCFPSLSEVPEYALTVTCPVLVSARHIFCVVPGARKSRAVSECLTGPVSERCPASILRRSGDVRMYIDRDCAGALAV